MNLEERTMLVKLSITQWNPYKTDREVSLEVNERKNARLDAGKFRKRLMAKDAMKTIQQLATSARSTHNAMTLPWNDDGTRIIITDKYQAYAKEMRTYRIKMQQAVEDFLGDYEKHVAEAKAELGDLFKDEDYPSIDEIKSKFRLDVEPSNVPVASDFRAKVSNADVQAIMKDIEKRTEARLKEAMKDVWARIANVTERMAKKLEEYQPRVGIKDAEGIFRDSLVTNIRDLVDVLPSLNITDDEKLTAIHKEMVEHLCKFDADELREDERARRKTQRKAKAIYDKVSKYL